MSEAKPVRGNEQKLGRVTAVNPLRVRLNGDPAGDPVDPQAEPYAGMTMAVGKEVLVVNVEKRRLVVWAAL